MMSITQSTRRESFEKAQETAPRWRDEVYSCLRTFGPLTAFEVAEKVGKPVYQVRPRLTELRKVGLIAAVNRKVGPMGRSEAIWSAEPKEEKNQFLLQGM